MKRYNDYEVMTFNYLKNYNQFKIAIKNLETDKEIIIEQLTSFSVAISKYSAEAGGGYNELSQTESSVDRRIKLEGDLAKIEFNLKILKGKIEKIDRSLAALNPDSKNIIEKRFFDTYDWWQIARLTNYSERWCQRINSKAVKELSKMIFGSYQAELDFNFVSAVDN